MAQQEKRQRVFKTHEEAESFRVEKDYTFTIETKEGELFYCNARTYDLAMAKTARFVGWKAKRDEQPRQPRNGSYVNFKDPVKVKETVSKLSSDELSAVRQALLDMEAAAE